MSSSLPGNLGSVSTSGGPNWQEYVLQGTILDHSSDALLHRLRALCDNVDQGMELFKDHEMVYILRKYFNGQGYSQLIYIFFDFERHNLALGLGYSMYPTTAVLVFQFETWTYCTVQATVTNALLYLPFFEV